MEALTTQAVSLIVIIGLNLLIALLVWSEYIEHKVRFLKYVALAQTYTLSWHFISIWLYFYSSIPIIQSFSLLTFFLSIYYLHAASTYKRFTQEKKVHRIAFICSSILFALSLFSGSLLFIIWGLNVLLLIAAPFVTLLFFQQSSKKLIAFFQLSIAVMFLASALFFNLDLPASGGLLYVLLALFQAILSVIFIIASVRLSRKEIAEREQNFRVFFESVNDVFFRLDKAGHIREVSPSISQFGFTAVQLWGKKIFHYLSSPDDFRDSLLLVNTDSSPVTYNGSFLTQSGAVDCEIICSQVGFDNTGQRQYAGSIRNTNERNLLEKQFIEAQRMESLAILAGGMAHDFNNLLQGIIGYTEILLETKNLKEEIRLKALNTILKTSTTAGNLCRQLLQYTGKGVNQQETLDLASSIEEVIEIMEPLCPENVEISLSLPQRTPFTLGDRSQIGQVIMNLLKNAIEAVGEKGEISISVNNFILDDINKEKYNIKSGVISGHYHLITIADSGPGIDPDIRGKIFDPFISSKEGGRGLGLSAVAGIIKIHGGSIYINPETRQGAEFQILLPAADSVNHVEKVEQIIKSSPEVLILLVEDDSTVRQITSKILEGAGNSVIQAKDGVEALSIFNASNETIEMVVTDIKMPKMDGITLTRKMQKISPDLPVVLMSGYADASDVATLLKQSRCHFLSKPFRAEELLRVIEKGKVQS